MRTNKNSQPKAAATTIAENNATPTKAAKVKKLPTPPSANSKQAKQSLPRVSYQLHQIEGTPYIGDRDTAAMLIRAYFTPEVWVQQHLFLQLTDSWGKLLCIRRIAVGDAHSCVVDTALIIDMATSVRATGITLGLTRPTGMLDAGLLIEKYITKLDDMLYLFGMQIEHFFIMGKDHEVDALDNMGDFRGSREDWNPKVLI